jgi:hypothetical protein
MVILKATSILGGQNKNKGMICSIHLSKKLGVTKFGENGSINKLTKKKKEKKTLNIERFYFFYFLLSLYFFLSPVLFYFIFLMYITERVTN